MNSQNCSIIKIGYSQQENDLYTRLYSKLYSELYDKLKSNEIEIPWGLEITDTGIEEPFEPPTGIFPKRHTITIEIKDTTKEASIELCPKKIPGSKWFKFIMPSNSRKIWTHVDDFCYGWSAKNPINCHVQTTS